MSIFRKVDKVLAAFGNIRAMERTHVDNYTDNLINNVRDKKSKLASSQYGEIWYSFQDISDYKFLNISIISSTNIKTLRGSKLIFFDNVTEHVINSDTLEIESDFSNISNLYLTNIDFVIEGNDDKLITKKHFDKVNFHFNKKAISFNKA